MKLALTQFVTLGPEHTRTSGDTTRTSAWNARTSGKKLSISASLHRCARENHRGVTRTGQHGPENLVDSPTYLRASSLAETRHSAVANSGSPTRPVHQVARLASSWARISGGTKLFSVVVSASTKSTMRCTTSAGSI